jgi:hypothetical protein
LCKQYQSCLFACPFGRYDGRYQFDRISVDDFRQADAQATVVDSEFAIFALILCRNPRVGDNELVPNAVE